jgi:hypothetical protein
MVGLLAEYSRGQKSEIGNRPAYLSQLFNIPGSDFPGIRPALELVLTPNDVSAGIHRMMKTRIAGMAVALSFMGAAFCFGAAKTTEPAASPAAAKTAKTMAPKKEAAKMNPQLGTWKLNEAKSKFPAGMGKNTTVTYTEQKDNIKVTVVGVDKDGKPTHSVWVGKFDGKAYPVKGNLPYNSVAYKMVNDRTNDITTMKDGKVVWSGRIEVSKDGKSRTVTLNGTGADGKKFKGKAFYDKA